MTRDVERYITRLRRTADEVEALPLQGADFVTGNRLCAVLRERAHQAERIDTLLTTADYLKTNYPTST